MEITNQVILEKLEAIEQLLIKMNEPKWDISGRK